MIGRQRASIACPRCTWWRSSCRDCQDRAEAIAEDRARERELGEPWTADEAPDHYLNAIYGRVA